MIMANVTCSEKVSRNGSTTRFDRVSITGVKGLLLGGNVQPLPNRRELGNNDAPIEAAMRADAMLEAGDLDGLAAGPNPAAC
jgi:hypothetical protein